SALGFTHLCEFARVAASLFFAGTLLYTLFTFLWLRDDECGQIRLLDQVAHFGQILILKLRPFFQLLLELAAQRLKNVELRFGWFTVAAFDQVAEGVKPLI